MAKLEKRQWFAGRDDGEVATLILICPSKIESTVIWLPQRVTLEAPSFGAIPRVQHSGHSENVTRKRSLLKLETLSAYRSLLSSRPALDVNRKCGLTHQSAV
jgi:hypothetical protein